MPNLKDIKNRINNVAISQKVTFSMKNIASAKLAQARRFYYSSQVYLNYNKKILQYLLLNFKKNGIQDGNPLSKVTFFGNNNLPKLLFVVGADRGLCGAFNINIIKATENVISNLKLNNKDFFIVVLGNKVKSYFNGKYKDKVYSLPYKLDIGSFGREESLLIVNYIFNLIYENKIGSLDFIFTNFVSVLESTPRVEQVFPIDFSSINKDSNNNDTHIEDLNIVTDKFIGSVINNVIKDVILSWVYNSILNSLTSEYASRVNAMDNAANNSEELLTTLSLEYNRTRQSLITKELIEIISGNEAL